MNDLTENIILGDTAVVVVHVVINFLLILRVNIHYENFKILFCNWRRWSMIRMTTSGQTMSVTNRGKILHLSPHTRAFLRLGIASATLTIVTPVKRDRVGKPETILR